MKSQCAKYDLVHLLIFKKLVSKAQPVLKVHFIACLQSTLVLKVHFIACPGSELDEAHSAFSDGWCTKC